MTVYFAMIERGGESVPAFFLTEKSAPEGAVAITEKRHAQLLEAQGAGLAVAAGKGGKPKIVPRTAKKAERIAELTAAIRKEAAARIAAVSPLWRQLNDTRAPSAEGAARFARIDAIREASDAIEETLGNLTAAALDEFPVRDHPLWPELD